VRSRLHIDSLIGKVVITPESSVQILETVIGIQSKLAFDEWKYLKVGCVLCVGCVLLHVLLHSLYTHYTLTIHSLYTHYTLTIHSLYTGGVLRP
jgi:hypothetical protein